MILLISINSLKFFRGSCNRNLQFVSILNNASQVGDIYSSLHRRSAILFLAERGAQWEMALDRADQTLRNLKDKDDRDLQEEIGQEGR